MIKINDAVRDLLYSDEEALAAFARGFINLTAYARQIQPAVAKKTKKSVGLASIIVTLSRLQKQLPRCHPLVETVTINNLTTKSPLTEMVFAKSPTLLARLSKLYDTVKTSSDDFLTMTVGTSELSVICSDRLKTAVLTQLKAAPLLTETGLASIGLSLDGKYYTRPNITFSLLRRIAQKRIVLAETITTYREIIFVFKTKNLATMLELFSTTID